MSTEFTLSVSLFDGQSPLARPAMLGVSAARARVEHEHGAHEYAADELRVSPRVAHAPRFIALPDGRELSCPDCPLLDLLPERERSEGLVAWLERRQWVVLLSVLVTAVALFLANRLGLPRLAASVATHMPVAYEHELGVASLERLDQSLFRPSAIESSQKESLRGELAHLIGPRRSRLVVALEFRSSDVGANAFALPGGTIILTDDLVRACTTDQVAAVLAHELGHVERHHAVRQLIEDAGAGALVTAVLGDASTLGVAIAGVPTVLLNLEYSRELESEADDEAFRLLAASGRAPGVFADALDCIERTLDRTAQPVSNDERSRRNERTSFLSSHPGFQERRAKARSAPGN